MWEPLQYEILCTILPRTEIKGPHEGPWGLTLYILYYKFDQAPTFGRTVGLRLLLSLDFRYTQSNRDR